MSPHKTLEVPAIAIRQAGKHNLYAFAIDGKQLHDIAQVSRLARTEKEEIEGYQRPEVVSHISEIKTYLESPEAMLPNAIVVAFDSRVTFKPLNGDEPGAARHGHLVIPQVDDHDHPGWIVDGQQRAAAIRDADIEGFPVFVTAFITDSVAQQREQFILVNSTKPLPKGLIYELLPSTDAPLPLKFEKKRFPTYLLERLNFDSRSPFHRMIQTPTTPDGVVKDNSILRMLENSLNDGALCRFKAGQGESDVDQMLELLFNYWTAVAVVFKDAWNQPARKSRLTHGCGIMSLGYVMDAICDRYKSILIPTTEQFANDLRPLQPHCSWMTGYWHFGPGMQRKWNELQNTSKDIQLVANYLLGQYKRTVWL
jgi:DGQHR domain-containing protein